MIVGGLVGQGHLVPHPNGQPDPVPNRQKPDDESWRKKHLVFVLVLPIGPIGVIDLQCGPQHFDDSILEGGEQT